MARKCWVCGKPYSPDAFPAGRSSSPCLECLPGWRKEKRLRLARGLFRCRVCREEKPAGQFVRNTCKGCLEAPPRECCVKGCAAACASPGVSFCPFHYHRNWRTGDPQAGVPARRRGAQIVTPEGRVCAACNVPKPDADFRHIRPGEYRPKCRACEKEDRRRKREAGA